MAVTQRGVMHDQIVFYRLVPLLDVRCSNKSASGNVDLVPEKGMLDKRYCIQVSLCKLGSTCSTHESVIFIAVFDIKITRCMYCRLTSIEFNSKCEQNSYILYNTADHDQASRYKFMSIINSHIMPFVDTPSNAGPYLGPPRLSTSLLRNRKSRAMAQ